MFKRSKKNILKTDYILYLLLIIAIFTLIFPLLGNKIVYGDDYEFHATNLILNYQNINLLKFDFMIPKVFGGTIANGFGYGTGIFYPPLSYYLTCYIAYFLNMLGFNVNLSVTFTQILIVILSSITMYMFIKRISNDKNVATIASISYISSVYFLCNIYGRVALAESLTFIFIPLIFLSLYELFYGDDNKFCNLFIIGYVGMINSHLVMTIYLTIFVLILGIFKIKKVFTKDKIKKIMISSIIVLLISSPYLSSLLEHKILGNYSVFRDDYMYTVESLEKQALTISDLFIIENGNVKTYLNFIILSFAIVTIIFNKKIFKKENKVVFKVSLFITIVSLFLTTKYFFWEYMPEFLKIIQFPWRLLGFVSFGLAILSGYIVKVFNNKKIEILMTIFISILIIISGYLSISHNRIISPVVLETMNIGTHREYLPEVINDNIAYYIDREKDIKINDGKAIYNVLEDKSPYLKIEIKLETEKVLLEIPRIYYLGYEIKLIDDKNNVSKINYYENKNGFIEFELDKSGLLEVSYVGTLLNRISNYVWIITIIICEILLICRKKRYNLKHGGLNEIK